MLNIFVLFCQNLLGLRISPKKQSLPALLYSSICLGFATSVDITRTSWHAPELAGNPQCVCVSRVVKPVTIHHDVEMCSQ